AGVLAALRLLTWKRLLCGTVSLTLPAVLCRSKHLLPINTFFYKNRHVLWRCSICQHCKFCAFTNFPTTRVRVF
ncbi:hypothetical protein L9F63_002719, partial [Diploptera punctata]